MRRTDLALVIAGILATFFLGFTVIYAIPMLDPDLAEVSDQTLARGDAALAGKQIYDAEGCWYCHTQQVRAVSNDLGLGKATMPDRVARDDPSVLGLERVGPDLGCVADRFESSGDVAALLTDPRAVRVHSTKPSFGYLTSEELASLAAYLMTLSC